MVIYFINQANAKFDKLKSLTWWTITFLPRGVYSGWCIVIAVLVRMSVCTSVQNFFWDFCFFLDRPVLDDFFIFWKKWFFEAITPFFYHFSDIQGLTWGRCKSGFMLERFCSQILNLHSATPGPFFLAFLKKALVGPAD